MGQGDAAGQVLDIVPAQQLGGEALALPVGGGDGEGAAPASTTISDAR